MVYIPLIILIYSISIPYLCHISIHIFFPVFFPCFLNKNPHASHHTWAATVSSRARRIGDPSPWSAMDFMVI